MLAISPDIVGAVLPMPGTAGGDEALSLFDARTGRPIAVAAAAVGGSHDHRDRGHGQHNHLSARRLPAEAGAKRPGGGQEEARILGAANGSILVGYVAINTSGADADAGPDVAGRPSSWRSCSWRY